MRRFISRLPRFLVPAMLIAPVIFICGKLLLTPVKTTGPQSISPSALRALGPFTGPVSFQFFDRGWPWPFMDTVERTTASVSIGPNLTPAKTAALAAMQAATAKANERAIQDGNVTLQLLGVSTGSASPVTATIVQSFSWPWLLVDVGVLLAIIALAVLILVRHYRRHNFGWRFSLRSLFVMTTVVGLALGWWMYHYSRWKRQSEFFQRFPGVNLVKYDPSPRWTRCLLNPSDFTFMCRPQEVALNSVKLETAADKAEFLAVMSTLPQVHEARIKGPAADATLEAIAALPEIRTLILENFEFTDEGLKHLAGSKSLEEFNITGHFTKATDVGVAAICKIKSLRKMSLFFWNITDASIDSILQASQLEELDLAGCKHLTDAAVRRLLEMPHLKKLIVNGPPQISDETLRVLQSHIETVVAY